MHNTQRRVKFHPDNVIFTDNGAPPPSPNILGIPFNAHSDDELNIKFSPSAIIKEAQSSLSPARKPPKSNDSKIIYAELNHQSSYPSKHRFNSQPIKQNSNYNDSNELQSPSNNQNLNSFTHVAIEHARIENYHNYIKTSTLKHTKLNDGIHLKTSSCANSKKSFNIFNVAPDAQSLPNNTQIIQTQPPLHEIIDQHSNLVSVPAFLKRSQIHQITESQISSKSLSPHQTLSNRGESQFAPFSSHPRVTGTDKSTIGVNHIRPSSCIQIEPTQRKEKRPVSLYSHNSSQLVHNYRPLFLATNCDYLGVQLQLQKQENRLPALVEHFQSVSEIKGRIVKSYSSPIFCTTMIRKVMRQDHLKHEPSEVTFLPPMITVSQHQNLVPQMEKMIISYKMKNWGSE